MYNHFKKAILVMALFFCSLNSLHAKDNNNSIQEINEIANQEMEILIDKKYNPHDTEADLENLSFNVLSSFRKRIIINIEKNNNIDDFAEASRFYQDYQHTTSCTVTINNSTQLDKSSKKNPMIKAGFNTYQMKEFIYIHELAHCLDAEPPLKGVDPIAWREALADGYASYMMYRYNVLASNVIFRFANIRIKMNEDGGAGKMQLYLLENIEKMNQKIEDPLHILNEIKKLRYKMFTDMLNNQHFVSNQ